VRFWRARPSRSISTDAMYRETYSKPSLEIGRLRTRMPARWTFPDPNLCSPSTVRKRLIRSGVGAMMISSRDSAP
jgi:hypothetical protein